MHTKADLALFTMFHLSDYSGKTTLLLFINTRLTAYSAKRKIITSKLITVFIKQLFNTNRGTRRMIGRGNDPSPITIPIELQIPGIFNYLTDECL